MNAKIQAKWWALPLVLLLSASLVGCGTSSETRRRAAQGAGAGAVIGGAAGTIFGGTVRGAIIGAVVGGTAGAVIGREMDRQAKEIESDVEGTEVKRVGEGIALTFESGVLFDSNSSRLSPQAKRTLSDLAANLNKYEDKRQVLIVGHTDSEGAEASNQRLAEARAEAVADFLAQEGVPRSQVSTSGKGEREPIASNETVDGRQQNRRVEIAIYASQEYRQEVEQEEG